VLTRFRLAIFAAAALGAVWASQAVAFWPFGAPARVSIAPAYGGTCEDCDLSGRILVGAKLSGSVFNGSNFSHAVLARADASDSQFVAVDFTEADLTYTSLVRARCENAVFPRAQFRGAQLRGASFHGADLRLAEGLTQDQLDEACGDASTRLPRGLSIPRCEGGER
jgi:uncharacterized protein YjbI with pentapeptide repeats